MARASEESLGRRFRTFLRTYRFALSIFLFATGVLLSVLAVGGLTGLSAYPPFSDIDGVTTQPNVNYNLVFVVVGPIVAIVGAYFLTAYILARRRFEHLMSTRSKAEFLRNLPEIEKLLWDLTPADDVRYANKKAELRIRR